MTFAQKIDFKSIPVIEVARELLGEESKERSTPQEKHFSDHGGLFVNVNKNRWFSYGNATGGDALNLVCFVKDCDVGAGIRWLRLRGHVPQSEGFRQNGKAHSIAPMGSQQGKGNDGPAHRFTKPNTPQKHVVAAYDYTDESGEVLSRKVRYDPKGFGQCKPGGSGGWIWNVDDVRRVPYRLPELIEAVASERTIFIAEGEKAVEALVKLDVPATCAGGALKWRDDYSKHLAGATVIILPDNDEPGRKARDQIAKSLTGMAASIKVSGFAGIGRR